MDDKQNFSTARRLYPALAIFPTPAQGEGVDHVLRIVFFGNASAIRHFLRFTLQ
jgi:hypothetical protein